jgi:hypothetical protein
MEKSTMNPLPGIATITLNPAIDQSVAIPDFAAGSVNRVAWTQSDPGGKGVNVASFLADLGFRVAVTGLLGRDNAGVFEQLFAAKGISDAFVRIPGNTRVNVKIIDETSQRITDINFPGPAATAEDLDALGGGSTRCWPTTTASWFPAAFRPAFPRPSARISFAASRAPASGCCSTAAAKRCAPGSVPRPGRSNPTSPNSKS